MVDDPWVDIIFTYLLTYRITSHATTGVLPCKLFLQRNLRIKSTEVCPCQRVDSHTWTIGNHVFLWGICYWSQLDSWYHCPSARTCDLTDDSVESVTLTRSRPGLHLFHERKQPIPSRPILIHELHLFQSYPKSSHSSYSRSSIRTTSGGTVCYWWRTCSTCYCYLRRNSSAYFRRNKGTLLKFIIHLLVWSILHSLAMCMCIMLYMSLTISILVYVLCVTSFRT